MATRHERVVLTLDDRFTTEMARAATATALLDRELKGLSRSAGRTQKPFQGAIREVEKYATDIDGAAKKTGVFEQRLTSLSRAAVQTRTPLVGSARDVDRVGRSADRTGDSINQLTGRLRLMADAAVVVGPSLVPIAAVGIPAVTGLASQLGFAAVAGISLVGAMQGVGDALKAVEAARLDPTAANLEKARDALSKLGPDAQKFVHEFNKIRPTLAQIRDDSAAGWFPGLTEALDDLDDLGPKLGSISKAVGTRGGDLIAEGAKRLAGPEWDEFWNFVEHNAPDAIDDLFRTLGNLTKGLAELWMAFDPTNDKFGDWLLEKSRDFAKWSKELKDTNGYREFIDYIDTNGPRVAATAGAIGTAIVEIVEAVAPLGGPSLKIIELFADAVSAIADSDLGTPILAGVAALALLNRALQVTAALQTRLTGSKSVAATMEAGGLFGGLAAGRSGVSAGIRGTVADLRRMGTEYDRVNRAQSMWLSGLSQTSGAAQRTASRLKTLGKTSAVVGGLTVATTGLADGMGLSNTMSLGLMGTLAGPWGAAVGAGAGLLIDLRSAGQRVNETFGHTDDVFKTNAQSIRAYGTSLSAVLSRQRQFIKQSSTLNLDGSMDVWSFDGIGSTQGWKDRLGVGESSLDKYRKDMKAAKADMDALVLFFNAQIRDQWGEEGFLGKVQDERWKSEDNPFGYNLDLLKQTDEVLQRLQPSMDHYGLTIEDLIKLQSGDEIDGAGWEEWNNRLVEYAAYLDSAQGRTDAFTDAVGDLNNSALTTAQSASAMAEALAALLDPNINLSAQRDAWVASLRSLNDELAEGSKTLKGNSDAALQNRAAVRDRVSQLQELLSAEAASGASSEQLSRKLRNQRRALIEAGVAAGMSRGEIKAYIDQLGLTPKLVKTLIEANASGAFTTLERVSARLAALNGSTAWVHVKSTAGSVAGLVGSSADGSTVPDDGGGYRDYLPYLLAPREEVTSNRNGQADRFRPELKDINRGLSRREVAERMMARGLATGGTTGKDPSWVSATGSSSGGGRRGVEQLEKPDRKGSSRISYVERASAGRYFIELANGAAYMVSREGLKGFKGWHKALRDLQETGLKGVTRALKRAETAMDNETRKRDDLVSTMDTLSSAIRDRFTSEVFPETDVWAKGSSIEDANRRLDMDTAESNRFNDLVATLKSKGLDGPALDELLARADMDTIANFAAGSRAQLADYERKYELRTTSTSRAGKNAAEAAYGKQLDAANRNLADIRGEVRELRKELKQEQQKNREQKKRGNAQGSRGRKGPK